LALFTKEFQIDNLNMPRWSEEETLYISQVRERVHDKLTNRKQYPEVVGDRKILRYIISIIDLSYHFM